MKIQPIILAAGKGTRMNNPDLPKVLAPLKERPIISYLLDTITKTGFMTPALVVGYHQEKVREALGNTYTYITQEQQLGTGHAVAVTREALEGTADAYLVMCGDTPLLSLESIQKLIAAHETSKSVLSLATLVSDNEYFRSFGRIIRDENGIIKAIREYKDCTDEEKAIQEVNPGLYCFNDSWLWSALEKIDQSNAQGEFYITDLLSIAVEEGQVTSSIGMKSWQETLGINTPEQLAEAEKWV